METLVSCGSELLPYSSRLRETGWCLETSLKSNVLCPLYVGHLKKKCGVFSTLSQLQNEESDMFLGTDHHLMSYSLSVNVCVRFVISDCL